MKKFAVGYISFFDNELIVEIVEADDFKSAILKHSKIDCNDKNFKEWYDDMPNNLSDVKSQLADGEIGIDVKEIV